MGEREDEVRTFIDDLRPRDVALLRAVANEAAEATAKRMFLLMGLDPDQPIKSQRDFNFLRDLVHDEDLKNDMSYLRRSRVRSEGMSGKAFNTAIGLAVLGAVHAVWSYAAWLLKSLPAAPGSP